MFCTTWKPAVYQGKYHMKGYFEGWYYKIANRQEEMVGAFIPGVSFSPDGRNSHAFIQFLDNSGTYSNDFEYDLSEFWFSADKPEVRIGKSFFSPSGIKVNIEANGTSIHGALTFKDAKPWPVSLFSPGAMGWYAFVPFMQCYHGVVSFDHTIEGSLQFYNKEIDFTGGRGYIEKDWGRSFPSYHIWIQTNHFEELGTSLMVSVANVPWLGRYFDGFLIGLWYKNYLYKFATYTGAKIVRFEYTRQNLILHVKSRHHRLEVEAPYVKGASLKTPVQGNMQGRLSESLKGVVSVKLFDTASGQDNLLFSGHDRNAGMEIEGNIPQELKQ
jgi:tocopherol cyclase